MKIGDPDKEDTMVGATISEEQAEKTLSYIEQARKEVCVCVCMCASQCVCEIIHGLHKRGIITILLLLLLFLLLLLLFYYYLILLSVHFY